MMIDFEFIELKGWLWIHSSLKVAIIDIQGDWIEWYFENYLDGEEYSEPIHKCYIKEEIDGERKRRYFTQREGESNLRIFYLDEFVIPIKFVNLF